MSKVKSYGLKAYVSKTFGLDVGSRIKRTKRGEEEKEHIYEVKQLFHIAFCWKIFTITQGFVLAIAS